MKVEIEAIAARIVQFLKRAAIELEPARDVPDSEQICRDLLDVLDKAAAWGVADEAAGNESWQRALEGIAERVAVAFKDRAEEWPTIATLVRVYFRTVLVEEHSRAEKRYTHPTPSGKVLRSIEIGLLKPFLVQLLGPADQDTRIRFFDVLDDRPVCWTLADALDALVLSALEAAALLRCLCSQKVNALGLKRREVTSWAVDNSAVAKEVVDGWMREVVPYRDLSPDAMPVLVEAVVGGHREEMSWRNHLIAGLTERNDEGSWALAAYLACHAWPKEPIPAVSERHALLLEHVRRLPERLLGVGLRCMVREADANPVEAIETTVQLVELGSARAGRRAPDAGYEVLVAEIATFAIRALPRQGAGRESLKKLYPIILRVAPENVPYNGLDSFFCDLAEVSVPEAFSVVGQWLNLHARSIVSSAAMLRDLLPLTINKIGFLGEADWVVQFMMANVLAVRRVAEALWARGGYELPTDFLEKLSTVEAKVLACHIAASPMIDPSSVRLLMQLGVANSPTFDVVLDILINGVVSSYPGACRDSIEIWDKAAGGGRADLARGATAIRQRLEDLAQAHERRAKIAEIYWVRPASGAWNELWDREYGRLSQDASSKASLASLFSTVSIARGDMVAPLGHHGMDPISAEETSTTFELSLTDVIDPFAAHLRRIAYRRQAEALLAERDNEGKPS